MVGAYPEFNPQRRFHGESLAYAFLILLSQQWLAKNIVNKVDKSAMLNSGSMLNREIDECFYCLWLRQRCCRI
jgi:hypothetical protein